jgi:hypothetical protein
MKSYQGISGLLRMRKGRLVACICGSILFGGCADVVETPPPSEHVSPPPKARATAQEDGASHAISSAERKAALKAAAPAWQASALRQLTPELQETFRLAGSIGDQAGPRYDAAVAAIRRDAVQRRALRAFYDELPITSYAARQQVVLLAGLVGESEEVPMLEKLTLTPLEPVTPGSLGDESHHQPTTVDQESELRNAAVIALSRIAQRGEAAAYESLVRLLGNGDALMAILAGVELAELGKLGAAERSVLVARGIRGSFAKLDFEKTFRIDPSGANANVRRKPAVPPPSALPESPNSEAGN